MAISLIPSQFFDRTNEVRKGSKPSEFCARRDFPRSLGMRRAHGFYPQMWAVGWCAPFLVLVSLVVPATWCQMEPCETSTFCTASKISHGCPLPFLGDGHGCIHCPLMFASSLHNKPQITLKTRHGTSRAAIFDEGIILQIYVSRVFLYASMWVYTAQHVRFNRPNRN